MDCARSITSAWKRCRAVVMLADREPDADAESSGRPRPAIRAADAAASPGLCAVSSRISTPTRSCRSSRTSRTSRLRRSGPRWSRAGISRPSAMTTVEDRERNDDRRFANPDPARQWMRSRIWIVVFRRRGWSASVDG